MADRSTAFLSGSLSRVVCGCWPRPSRFLTDGVSDRSLTQTQLAEAGGGRIAETTAGDARRRRAARIGEKEELYSSEISWQAGGAVENVRFGLIGQDSQPGTLSEQSDRRTYAIRRQASRNIRGDPAGPINPRFFWPRRRMRRERGAIDMCSFHRRRGQIVSLCHSQGVHSRPPVGQINLPATDCPAVVDSSSGLWAVLLKSARHNSLPSSLSTIQTRGPSATVFAE